jgi:ring-1,2-phenylacetyl-CoA epoxidase subunit PaaC
MSATDTMTSLIGSLADNKAALGRRYGEWAVSAPTLESAVAAAAMAQDELGHARSTYPVLKQLGASEPESEGGRRLAVLDAELPDWTTFIAVNLVVDGVLTAFVEASTDSSLEPLAQRARKILQEEGSHRVHAEAWTRRLLSRDGSLLPGRIVAVWDEASRWYGPDDDAGFAAAVSSGMIALGPAALRSSVAARVSALAGVELASPADWSDWDAERRR